MKKNLLTLLAAAALALPFAACNDSNKPDYPALPPLPTNDNILVLNNGNQGWNLPGSITLQNTRTNETIDQAFRKANDFSIGDTPQAMVRYGSKLYIAVSQSSLVWVADAISLQVIEEIPFKGETTMPRGFAVGGGKVFVSLFSGQVARIDTLSLKVDKVVESGPNPEQMAIADGKLYVANSDGNNYLNGYADSSVAVFTLPDLTDRQLVNPGINPYYMGASGSQVFVLCRGNYADVPSRLKVMYENGSKVTDICDATNFTVMGGQLYVINSPWAERPSKDNATYEVWSIATGQKIRNMVKQKADFPVGVAVDPYNGEIVVLSQSLSTDGKIDYQLPGYANVYDREGYFLYHFPVGTGPVDVAFIHL